MFNTIALRNKNGLKRVGGRHGNIYKANKNINCSFNEYISSKRVDIGRKYCYHVLSLVIVIDVSFWCADERNGYK